MLFCISQFPGLLLTVYVLKPWWRLVVLDLAFSMEGLAISWQPPSVPVLPIKGNWAPARDRSSSSWRENSGKPSSSTSQSCWVLLGPWSTNKLNFKTNYFSVRCLTLHCHNVRRGIYYRDTSYSYFKSFFQYTFYIKCYSLKCKTAQPAFPNCSCGSYLIQERQTQEQVNGEQRHWLHSNTAICRRKIRIHYSVLWSKYMSVFAVRLRRAWLVLSKAFVLLYQHVSVHA